MDTRRDSRRFFLQSATGLALASRVSEAAPPKDLALPKVRLGNHEITRLIVGSNPFNGYSYALPSLDRHMVEWSTDEHVGEVLRNCEQNGINTWQFSYNPRGMSALNRYQREGGKLQWILLGGGEMKDNLSLIPGAAKLGPIGIVHHGGVTDQRFRAGEMGKVHDFLKKVQDSGVMAGLSMHNPAVMEYVEERGWAIDFYMTCFYQLTRPKTEIRKMLGEMPLGTVFLEGDAARMCRFVRQTRKTCLAFKILAAGRLAARRQDLEQAFRFAFDNIKPQDCVIVGMYPRFKDEVRENADLVRSISSKVSLTS
jgi:hypothetical protein